MSDCILFQPEGAPVAIMYPVTTHLTSLEIGQKDVPTGLPFWIVDIAALPEDRAYRDSWELDVGAMWDPSGYGGTYVPREPAEYEEPLEGEVVA